MAQKWHIERDHEETTGTDIGYGQSNLEAVVEKEWWNFNKGK